MEELREGDGGVLRGEFHLADGPVGPESEHIHLRRQRSHGDAPAGLFNGAAGLICKAQEDVVLLFVNGTLLLDAGGAVDFLFLVLPVIGHPVHGAFPHPAGGAPLRAQKIGLDHFDLFRACCVQQGNVRVCNQILPLDLQGRRRIGRAGGDDQIAAALDVEGLKIPVLHGDPHGTEHLCPLRTAGLHPAHLLPGGAFAEHPQVVGLPELRMPGIGPLHDDEGLVRHQTLSGVPVGVGIEHPVGKGFAAPEVRNHLFQKPLIIHIAPRLLQPLRGAEPLGQEKIVHVDHGGVQPLCQQPRQGRLARGGHAVHGDDHRARPALRQRPGTRRDLPKFLFKKSIHSGGLPLVCLPRLYQRRTGKTSREPV